MMSMNSTSEVGGGTAGPGSGPASVLVRGPGEGPGTWVLGSLFERLASGEETGGGFALSLVTQPPGTATPVHIHTLEDEAFYLLDGTMTYQLPAPDQEQLMADVHRWLETAPRYGLSIVGPPLPADA
jgi:hypothetical protein